MLPGPKYRLCENQIVSKSEFSLLYSRLGDAFNVGGEGADEFRLPPSEGLVFVGFDAGDSDFDAVGATGGTKAATMPTHDHTISPNPHTHVDNTVSTPAGSGGAAGGDFAVTGSTTTTGGTTLTVGSTAGTGDNMPPFVVASYIIKVQ